MNKEVFSFRNLHLWIIGIGLLFPLSFRLVGGIYKDAIPMYDSKGSLLDLPLPISIIICAAAGIYLIKNYRRASISLLFAISMLLFMTGSLIFAGPTMDIELRKLILMLQFLLPVMGLALGQMVQDDHDLIAKAFLSVIVLIVPIQLCATYLQHTHNLTHYLYWFSIYAHFQYVTLIFVCAFAYSMTVLWESHKLIFLIMLPVMFLYVTRSYSFITITAYFCFVTMFFAVYYFKQLKNIKWALIFLGVVASCAILMVHNLRDINSAKLEVNTFRIATFGGKFDTLLQGKIPSNIQERFDIWGLYTAGIAENAKTLLLGQTEPLPRNVRTSAHNWYLDLAYNYGLMALLPISCLIVYTCKRLWQGRKYLPAHTLWLGAIVMYLVILDNNFKVTLRQPYPGIFAYFLWGLLLSKLTLDSMNHNRISSPS